ncbi:hypothetical protein HYR99_36525 [Candidatus Poribacteria bacterium]|nr:hypothetical protein [Candidatus Poribacteria bacterium]
MPETMTTKENFSKTGEAQRKRKFQMNTAEIQKKAKKITNASGKIVEVILPHKVYQELLDLKISLEIYEQEEVQQSIKSAQKDIENGNIKSFQTVDEAFEWLDK